MGRPVCQVNWRAEKELAVPEFLMKAKAKTLIVSNLNSCVLTKIVTHDEDISKYKSKIF